MNMAAPPSSLVVDDETILIGCERTAMNHDLLAKAKSLGFSDRQIAHLTGQSEDAVRALRKRIRPGAQLSFGGHLRG